MDIRIHHHLAQEYYRQQMFQRIPGKYNFFRIQKIHQFVKGKSTILINWTKIF